MFDYARNCFLAQITALDWDTDTHRLIFVDHADDIPLPAADDFLDDILAPARVAESGDFTGESADGTGVADANDVTVAAVVGDEFESIVFFKETGVDGTSVLIGFIDTATGLPCTPNGGDITVQWDAGANKIFKL